MQNFEKITLKTMDEESVVTQNEKTNSSRLAHILGKIGAALNMQQLANYK